MKKSKVIIPEVEGFGFEASVNKFSDGLRYPISKRVPKAKKNSRL